MRTTSTQQSGGGHATNKISRNNKSNIIKAIVRERNKRTFGIVCSKYDSCRERCHNNNNKRSINNQAYNCYCDDQCYSVYQDCCYDYEMYCGKEQHGINKMQVLDRSMVSCIPGYEARSKNIWMVTKCSRGWLNKETLYDCENVSKSSILKVENIYQYLAVIDVNNTVYRNVFCAQCNNIENFTYFSLSITCPFLPPSSLSSLQEMISFVLEYCGHEHIFIVPGQNQARRYCSNLVEQNCRMSAGSEKCRKGSVAVVTANYINYKNVWCALCNGVPADVLSCGLKVSRGFSPFNYGRKLVPSFSLIMGDLKKWRVSSVSQKCPAAEIFDSLLEICRRGKFIPPVKDFIDKYYVVTWLQNLFPVKSSVDIDIADFRSALAQRLDLNATQITHVIVHKMENYYIVEFEVCLTNIQSLTVSIQSTKLNKELPQEMLSIADLLYFTDELIIQISLDLFKVFKVTSRRLACIGKQSYTKEEYILLKNEKYHIIKTNQTFSSNGVYHKGTNITICNDLVLSTCVGLKIYLQPQEYTKFPNLSVYYKRTQTLYNIGDYKTENDTLILCTKNTSIMRGRTSRKFDNTAMEILTIFTFSLSLVSLAALIFTYMIFSELRGLPGKNLLNLAVSLFLAQLLWLLGVPETKRPQLCTIITIIEHYLFLVTFTAMSVIAFHTKTTLASKKLRIPSTQIEDRRRFMIYSGFVWGVPLLFISITTFLHFVNVYDAGYSLEHERMACWIANRQAQEFLFILPVGLFVFFNTAMFIYTIIMIESNKQKSRELYASGNKRHEQNTVWIYLKLSSLTGLTWIFGFLDILVDSAIFSVLFVLFASLQGFYIALSFLINDRVVKLYRELEMRLLKRSK